MRLSVGDQPSRFLSILTRFGGYYHCFGVPKRFPWLLNPQGALTCRSSTVTVLADYGPFHGLLLPILGSRSDFHGLRTPGCFYVSVINTRGFGRLWPFHGLLLTDFGSLSDLLINKPRGAFMYRSSKVLGLSVSGLFYGLLLTVLGSQSDFHGSRAPRCAYMLVVKTRNLGHFWPVSWTTTHCFGVSK